MVLQKTEFDKQSHAGLMAKFKYAEKIIDANLEKGTLCLQIKDVFSYSHGEHYNNNPMRESLIKLIIARYTEAGWTVKRNNGYDQRDGDWDNLIFS